MNSAPDSPRKESVYGLFSQKGITFGLSNTQFRIRFMPKISFLSKSEKENLPIAKKILEACDFAKIFAFYGNLGAGKTTFIKSICKALGVSEEVTSPTFALVNEYQGEDAIVYHFDFYRIESEIEAYDIGIDEYLDSGAYCLIEWPERIPSILPAEAIQIQIQSISTTTRTIEVIF